MALNVALVSLGCSKNLVDSEVMISLLYNNNYKIVSDERDADVIIVNTCGFIESAKEESVDSILEMGLLKKKGKCKALIAAGCLSERYKDELLKEIPELDAVIGTGDYKNIVKVVEEVLHGNRVLMYGNQDQVDLSELPRITSNIGVTSYLKIAEGCDNHCTYCVIPSLRGSYRSRKIEDILKEANILAQSGIKELIVIAQDTTCYGKDIYGSSKLPELLTELCKIDGIEWIRLMYSYPDGFSEELIKTIAEQPKICKYLDIPIQHSSNKILKMMGRKSKKEDILSLLEKLREVLPEITIRTSLIVGFPGETEEDYEELLDFVKLVQFDRLGVFAYSREEGTPASQMKNHIEEDIKQNRLEQIMLLQRDISLSKNKEMVGKTLKVLVEEKNGNEYIGRSYKDAPEVDGKVIFKSNKQLYVGEFCYVKIKAAFEYDLLGENNNECS